MANKSVPQLDPLVLPVESDDLVHFVRDNVDFKGEAGELITYQTVTLVITNDQIVELNSTPVTVIAAQGSGTFINPTFATLTNNADGTTPYVVPGLFELSHDGSAFELFQFSNTLGVSLTLYKEAGLRDPNVRYLANTALEISASVANPSVGDHSFTVKVWYTIET